ncbi:nuclear transcription factor Y subunit beta-like [Drosophila suzukii]|uniref:Nuclear transcription factor Y subunit beta-like n=1 Tax=Drosophila suzukii TaxID=28584 RepID=A0ABM4TSG4_DROSZ
MRLHLSTCGLPPPMAAKQKAGLRFPKAAAQISRQHDLNYCTQQQQHLQQQQQHPQQQQQHLQQQHPQQQQRAEKGEPK